MRALAERPGSSGFEQERSGPLKILYALLLACCALGAATPAAAQVTGLVAWYALDETSGTQLTDSSPGGRDGTFVGGVTLGVPGPAPSAGTAVTFDPATQSHARIPNDPAFASLRFGCSVSAWIRPRTYGFFGSMRIFGNQNSAWSCGMTSIGLRFSARNVMEYSVQQPIPLGQWSHVAFVFDQNQDVQFFFDGVLLGIVNGDKVSQPAQPTWMIGDIGDNPPEYWDGELDEIQVYQGCLTAADVQFLFQNPGSVVGLSSTYCTAKQNSLGCTPVIAGSGLASASGATPMVVSCSQVLNSRPGLLFYEVNSLGNTTPFQCGTLCLGPGGIRRTPVTSSGGTPLPATDCTGVLSIDMSAFATGALGGAPSPSLGQPGFRVACQWWGRDPGFAAPCNTLLSDAIEYLIVP